MSSLIRLIFIVGILVVTSLLARHQVANQEHVVLDAASHTSLQANFDEDALATRLTSIINRYPGMNLSIAVADLQTNKQYAYGETDSFVAASISKLFTATLILQRVDKGELSLNQPLAGSSIENHLEKLIVESDNLAWHTFNDLLTHDALRSFAQSIGIQDYDPDANTLRSADAATLLNKLTRGSLLSDTSSERLFGYMSRANMRAYVVAGAPEGSSVYHKTGYLEDRLHDAAVLQKDSRSFILVIFSKTNGAYDFSRGAAVFKEITSLTSSLFFKAY